MVSKRTLPKGKILVDASLLIGIIDSDPRACRFMSILPRCIVTSINFGETLYKLDQFLGADPQKVERAFVGFGLQIDSFDLSAVRNFSALKRIDGLSRIAQLKSGVSTSRIKSLSLADLATLSYGLESNLPILTGDKHFLTLIGHGYSRKIFDYRDPSVML